MLLSYLPDQMKIRGETYILMQGQTVPDFMQLAKYWKIKYRNVKVLAKNLRGRETLHGKPYKPTEWIFFHKLGYETYLLKKNLPIKKQLTRQEMKEITHIKKFGYGT